MRRRSGKGKGRGRLMVRREVDGEGLRCIYLWQSTDGAANGVERTQPEAIVLDAL